MAKKLGRGLDALLGSETDFSQLTANGGDLTTSLNSGSARQTEDQRGGEARLGSTLTVRLDAIDPNPYQPRKEFAQEELQELAESIRKVGIIQPLTLRRNGDPVSVGFARRALRVWSRCLRILERRMFRRCALWLWWRTYSVRI